MKLIRKNKHNGITKKLFELIPSGSLYVLLTTSPAWNTVRIQHIDRVGQSPKPQWFGKVAIAELAKMAKLKG